MKVLYWIFFLILGFVSIKQIFNHFENKKNCLLTEHEIILTKKYMTINSIKPIDFNIIKPSLPKEIIPVIIKSINKNSPIKHKQVKIDKEIEPKKIAEPPKLPEVKITTIPKIKVTKIIQDESDH